MASLCRPPCCLGRIELPRCGRHAPRRRGRCLHDILYYSTSRLSSPTLFVHWSCGRLRAWPSGQDEVSSHGRCAARRPVVYSFLTKLAANMLKNPLTNEGRSAILRCGRKNARVPGKSQKERAHVQHVQHRSRSCELHGGRPWQQPAYRAHLSKVSAFAPFAVGGYINRPRLFVFLAYAAACVWPP